ncbi:MAG TPA: hypothetical protein VJ997_10425 [Longimicrobiales bacterium]|nr:hypothetical protein [Longimicrobiales bacterium]
MLFHRAPTARFGAVFAVGVLLCSGCQPTEDRIQIEVTFPESVSASALDGRLLVVLSQNPDGEPRFQVTDGPGAQPVFGIDVDGWRPGATATLSDTVFGFPVARLGDLPAGTYRAQAVLNRYETFHRADGHTVKLPPDRGEGQQWARKPGNLYSQVVEFTVAPTQGPDALTLVLDQEIPAVADFAEQETEWVKYVRIRSDLLSDFWGTDMYLAAWVLLPMGWNDHPDARYPLAVFHGHFPSSFTHMRTEPPDTTTPCVYSDRFRLDCYNHVQEQWQYQLYKDWTSPNFPRHLVVEIQHPTPYYDDSYAVNSQAQGPWGDAIMRELIPEIERRYRGIGEGWARVTYGGSTGGWEAMAAQVLYPDDFNGAYVACPDPIDFRAYTVVNLYDDKNAYYLDDPFKRTPRPGHRDWLGHIQNTLEESNRMELALGTKSRSGGQWDIWEATFSPVGSDGYPRRIWDKVTGEIDPEVASYWRENYDLSYILRRDWATLGPKVAGKLHIYVGDMDNYYLNDAVYLTEDFLESTEAPYYAGEVDYGDRAEHCWNGDQSRPNAVSRLRYIQMFAPRMVQRMMEAHPAGADLSSWRY